MNKNGYQTTVPATYTGVVFLLSWTYLMFYASTAGIEAAAPVSLMGSAYTVSAACLAATLLVLSFSPIDRAKLLTSTAMKLCVGILLSAGSGLLILGGLNQSLALLIAGGIITGVFSGFMSLQWALVYQRVGLKVVANSFPTLMAMAVCLCATLMYLPSEALLAATIILPLVSEAMFHVVRKDLWPEFDDEEVDAKNRPINFVLMLLPFAVFALASGFLDFSSTDNNYTFIFYAFGAIIPVIVAGIFIFIVERNSFVGAFLIPLAVLIAVCVPFLTLRGVAPLAQFISIGELGIEVLIFVVAVGFAQFFSLDSLRTFALGRTVYALFNAIGWYLADAAANMYGSFVHSQVSIVVIFIGVEVLAICLIVAIVKARKNLPADPSDDSASQDAPTDKTQDKSETLPTETDEKRKGSDSHEKRAAEAAAEASSVPPQGTTSVSPEQLSDKATRTICERCGLSERERDVFTLLARGYTSPRIQKELYIAAGTVNYHARNIYAKLGVHSKQELIALFEQERMQS